MGRKKKKKESSRQAAASFSRLVGHLVKERGLAAVYVKNPSIKLLSIRGVDSWTSWCRPVGRNLFFLAQRPGSRSVGLSVPKPRPYLFDGTLREQIAYPVRAQGSCATCFARCQMWDDSLLSELGSCRQLVSAVARLNDENLERLFLDCNLQEVHGEDVNLRCFRCGTTGGTSWTHPECLGQTSGCRHKSCSTANLRS